MIRKVNLVGQNTLTISLPSKWVKHYAITKGDELDIAERGAILEISTKKSSPRKGKELAVEGIDHSILRYYIRYHYRSGVDRITIRFRDPHIMYYRLGREVDLREIIALEVNLLMGMEIIDQTKNSFTIKCMVKEEIDDFDDFLRKSLILIKESFNDLSGFPGGALLSTHHDALTRFISYCIRLLNKFGYKDYQKTIFLHSMLEALETITDIIDEIARHVNTNTRSLSKPLRQVMKDFAVYFSSFSDFYYKFSLKGAVQLQTARVDLYKKMHTAAASEEKKEIISYLEIILVVMRNSIGVRIGLEDG